MNVFDVSKKSGFSLIEESCGQTGRGRESVGARTKNIDHLHEARDCKQNQ